MDAQLQELPTHNEIKAKTGQLTKLDKFLLEHEPIHPGEAGVFRARLRAALNESRADLITRLEKALVDAERSWKVWLAAKRASAGSVGPVAYITTWPGGRKSIRFADSFTPASRTYIAKYSGILTPLIAAKEPA